jgi:hypothetical protein
LTVSAPRNVSVLFVAADEAPAAAASWATISRPAVPRRTPGGAQATRRLAQPHLGRTGVRLTVRAREVFRLARPRGIPTGRMRAQLKVARGAVSSASPRRSPDIWINWPTSAAPNELARSAPRGPRVGLLDPLRPRPLHPVVGDDALSSGRGTLDHAARQAAGGGRVVAVHALQPAPLSSGRIAKPRAGNGVRGVETTRQGRHTMKITSMALQEPLGEGFGSAAKVLG